MSDADEEKVAATDEENVFLESNEEDDAIGSVSSAAPCNGGITSTLYSAVSAAPQSIAHIYPFVIAFCINDLAR